MKQAVESFSSNCKRSVLESTCPTNLTKAMTIKQQHLNSSSLFWGYSASGSTPSSVYQENFNIT